MRFHHTSIRYRRLPGYRLTGWRAGGAFAACISPIVLGFAMPGAALLTWSIETAEDVIDARFLGFALNSFTLATITSAGIVTSAGGVEQGEFVEAGDKTAFVVPDGGE